MDKQEKITLTLYRHKTRKNLYLERRCSVLCEPNDRDIFRVTVSPVRSISSVRQAEIDGENFEVLMNHWPKPIEYTETRLINVDGYIGEGIKTVLLHLKDFEKVVLTEAEP